MREDVEAFEVYYGERENFQKYALRLLCPHHGVLAVRDAIPAGQIRGEGGGAGGRYDYVYTMYCGCSRRKDITCAVPLQEQALHLHDSVVRVA